MGPELLCTVLMFSLELNKFQRMRFLTFNFLKMDWKGIETPEIGAEELLYTVLVFSLELNKFQRKIPDI